MKQLLTAIALVAFAAASAHAVPQHLPAVDPLATSGTLYSVTYHDDTSATHATIVSHSLCFIQGPVIGSNTTGIWYATSYYRWIGRWRQEGDQIFMLGDFWTGPGNDAAQLELMGSRDEAFGHWEEWLEDGTYGSWHAKTNARMTKVGTCPPVLAAGDLGPQATWPEIEAAALREAEAAPVRYRKDGTKAHPLDRDQLPPK